MILERKIKEVSRVTEEIRRLVVGSFVSIAKVKDIHLNNALKKLDTLIDTKAKEIGRW